MTRENRYNMDILTGRKASVGYKIMVRPDGKRHIKDDVCNVMMAVDGKLSITADSTEYDPIFKRYRRTEKSKITIKLGENVVFCGGTEKLVSILTGLLDTKKCNPNVLD